MLAAAQGWAQGPCIGDCLNQGRVTVSDMVLGVNIVLEMQPPSACPNFQNARGVVDVAQLIQGVNHLLRGCNNVSPTPTRTPLFSGKQRTFVIAPGTPQAGVAQSTTGLFSSGTANNNAATAVCGKLAAGGQSCDTPAELHLLLDDEDMGDGIHDLVLETDATVEIGIVDGSRICLKFIASLTEGFIACDGGVPYDVAATRAAGQSGESFTFTRNLGPDAAAGNANLIVSSFYRILPAGDATPCGQGEYTGTLELPFTTTTGTATIEETDLELAVSGQAFSCDNFETPGSGGILTVPLPANQPPVGDVVNALRFGEQVP